ncbi:MAG: TonB-dependent receptor [Phenylobacterium sp.]|uniref:TonB-dependent receptor plug domain-containing protein n=1 Tax=Phenylobacterium sp. TaxID=1871053 RepID=UPI001A399715|nr:TonB-dependent receptor [Phenylobacterium sp.]MBL8553074.1 TonB-dependent receptor [Phenylobacterium sp.]
MLFYVLAQAAVAAAPAAGPQQGAITYPASFFAPYSPANAMEMVDRIPGFTFDSGSNARGYEGSAGNVLIDGARPATKTDDLEQILRRLPAGAVERIDIVRGGAPGIDMQGKTVIANVVKKAGGGARLLVAASQNHTKDGRTLLASRVEASGSLGQARWELGSFFGKGQDDGFGDGPGQRIDRNGAVTPVRVRGEGDSLQGYVTGAFETPLAGGKLKLNGRYYKDKYKGEETDIVGVTAPLTEVGIDVFRREDSEIGANYTRALGARTTLELVALRTDRERPILSVFFDADRSVFDLSRESSETIGRAVAKHRFSDRLSFEVGAETAINELNSETRLTVNGAAIPLPAGSVQVEEDRSEVFLKSAWRPAAGWTVDASVRLERSKLESDGDVVLEKTLSYVKPRVAVAWDVLPSTQVRVRLEREVGQLNFDDFVANASLNSDAGVSAGNPDLDPGQAWVAEAAVEQRFWDKGSLTLTFRHYELKDAVDRGPVTASDGSIFDRPANIGDGTKDELALEYNVPLDRVGLKGATLRGDVTRRWTDVTDPTTRTSREISELHPVDWNLNFTQDLAAGKLSWGVNAFGGWRETSYRYNLIQTTKLRTFVQPFVEWRPQPDLNIRFELENATARGLHRTVYAYAAPRNAPGAPAIDDRLYESGRSLYFRVRKTFG